MKAEERFLRQAKPFWANVRTISELTGYTTKQTRQIKIPSLSEMTQALSRVGLTSSHILDSNGQPTAFGQLLSSYFTYRATILNEFVQSKLMDASRAKQVYEDMHAKLCPQCPLPMNKQKREKRAPLYLTGIVNMLIEANAEGLPCNYDPQGLTTITSGGFPLRTLARRVDGAFPQVVDPVAVWEVKEYYYTTTFGSRVADGVYETLLDGLELEELRNEEGVDIQHYLILDAYDTWWTKGRSYLCRIIDMLHMGYVDEVLFGYEVVERLPAIVQEWVRIVKQRG